MQRDNCNDTRIFLLQYSNHWLLLSAPARSLFVASVSCCHCEVLWTFGLGSSCQSVAHRPPCAGADAFSETDEAEITNLVNRSSSASRFSTPCSVVCFLHLYKSPVETMLGATVSTCKTAASDTAASLTRKGTKGGKDGDGGAGRQTGAARERAAEKAFNVSDCASMRARALAEDSGFKRGAKSINYQK